MEYVCYVYVCRIAHNVCICTYVSKESGREKERLDFEFPVGTVTCVFFLKPNHAF